MKYLNMDGSECSTYNLMESNNNDTRNCAINQQELFIESTNDVSSNLGTSQITSTSQNLPINKQEIKSHPIESSTRNNQIQSSQISSQTTSLSLKKTNLRRIMMLNDNDSEDEEDSQRTEIFNDEHISDEKDESDENVDDPESIKAKTLLKNAVIIQSSIRRKKRVLESDDEDAIETTLDDIGIIEENNEAEVEEINNEIIIEEPPIISDDKDVSQEIQIMENLDEFDENERLYKELESIKPIDENDIFFKFDDSDQEDETSISNEKYFGTSDKRKINKKRGPKPKISQKRPQKVRKRQYEDDFVVSSDENSSNSSSESDIEVQNRHITIVKPQNIIKNATKLVKRDRFYDNSRDIPNEIYFGDIQVPLHVLHTKWSSDHIDNPSNTTKNLQFVPQKLTHKFPNSHQPAVETKLSNLKEFAKIAGIKINYSKLFDKVSTMNEKCMLIRKILYSKGLRGEPTKMKCRELRKEIQARKESAELDKSVIIGAEGRTRRSVRNQQTSNDYKNSIQPETLETLSRIKRVVDSDSE